MFYVLGKELAKYDSGAFTNGWTFHRLHDMDVWFVMDGCFIIEYHYISVYIIDVGSGMRLQA